MRVSESSFDPRIVNRVRSERAAAALLLMAGAALRLWQYLANSSLWIDEAALAHNIRTRDAVALIGPLDGAQVAPPGFLLIEKAVVSAIGDSELALRAFPLASGIAALFLFGAIARRLFPGWPALAAVGLFSLGIPFIYFAAQLKQYSSDIAAALALLLMALGLARDASSRRRLWLVALGGAGLVWLSHTAVFVAIGILTAQVILVVQDEARGARRRALIPMAVWTASAALASAHALSTVTAADGEYFRWFWADGMMPLPPRSLADLLWLPRKIVWVFGAFGPGLGWTNGGLHYRWSPLFALVMAAGFAALFRRQRDAALFLALPVVTVLALSALSIYPFTARLLAFVTPFLLLATVEGARWIALDVPRGWNVVTLPILAILGGAPVFAAASALPPSYVQHLRPVMTYLVSHRSPSDAVFVFYGAIPAFDYYAARMALPGERTIFGRCAVGDPRDYLRQLEPLRGVGRAWMVVTHTQREGELELMLAYLDRIGRRLDAVVVPASNRRYIEEAAAFLYDLSDPARLAAASADTFPIEIAPVAGSLGRWGCYGVTGRIP